jgi:xanthine dehydrogenase accessory factor
VNEIAAVCRAWFEASHASEPAWLATVVGVEGSSYRRPGARLLFGRESVLAGAVSGGCLERELGLTGPWLTRNGPVIKIFDSRAEDERAPGTGCEGKVHVLVEPLSAVSDGALSLIGRELADERRVVLATVLETDFSGVPIGARLMKTSRRLSSQVPHLELLRDLTGMASAALREPEASARRLSFGGTTILLEVLEPPPHLFVFGAGADAIPVVRMAKLLGWSVTVCGAAHVAARERFVRLTRVSDRSLAGDIALLNGAARPLAVVMAHDYRADRRTLEALLGTKAVYVGVLGPAHRTRRMLDEIERDGRAPMAAGRARVFGPAGLALGAETAEEIALSMLAEAQAVLSETEPVLLSERSGTIHARRAPDSSDGAWLAEAE